MKLKKAQFNYYGFDHKKVIAHFEGELTYVGTFAIHGSDLPRSVYHNAKPNRKKKHKDYMLLFTIQDYNGPTVMVSGMDSRAMEKERLQLGKYCPKCKEVIYSMGRHNYRECLCGECSVDGGKNYFRCSTAGETVEIDLLTGKVRKL